MKFNEFKPQLTEEQIVLSYCKSEITKEYAVSQLKNLPLFERETFTKCGPGLNRVRMRTKGGNAIIKCQRPPTAPIVRGGEDNLPTPTGSDADVTTPSINDGGNQNSRPDLDATGGYTNIGGGKKPTLKLGKKSGYTALEAVGDPEYREKPIARIRTRKNKRNSNNSKTTLALQNYLISTGADIEADGKMGPKTTLALQKYLISQGADIEADGKMGPKTRAAMRAEMERINPKKDSTDNDEIITLEPDAGAEEDPMIQAILDKEKEARRLDNLIKDKERGGAPTPTPTVPTPGGGGVGKIQPAPVDPVDPVDPAPEPDKEGGSPGTFFGFPIDDPEGGSDAFFGGTTLPQDEYDKMFGGDGDNMSGGGNPQYRPDKDAKPTKPKPSKPTKPKPSKPRPTPSKPSKPPRVADRTKPRRYNFPRPV